MNQKTKKEINQSNIQLKKAAADKIMFEDLSLAERVKNFFSDDSSSKRFDRKAFQNEIRQTFDKAGMGQLSDEIFKIIINSLMFKGTPVRSVMIPASDVRDIDLSSNLESVVKFILACGHSRIPVSTRNGKSGTKKIEGILYAKDLLKLLEKPGRTFSLKKMMRPALAVPDTLPIDQLMEEFRSRQLHIAIVVDEFGSFVGIITMEDITEEILGDFEDEYDKKIVYFKKMDDNSWEINGLAPVRDLNKELEHQFPEEHHRTVGGMVWHAFGKSPQAGESVQIDNFVFKVVQMRRKAIGKLLVSPAPNN